MRTCLRLYEINKNAHEKTGRGPPWSRRYAAGSRDELTRIAKKRNPRFVPITAITIASDSFSTLPVALRVLSRT